MTTPAGFPDGYDDEGNWLGPCDRCGGNHEGYPPDTLGGELRCVRARAESIGEPRLVAEVDEAMAYLDKQRDDFLRNEGLIP